MHIPQSNKRKESIPSSSEDEKNIPLKKRNPFLNKTNISDIQFDVAQTNISPEVSSDYNNFNLYDKQKFVYQTSESGKIKSTLHNKKNQNDDNGLKSAKKHVAEYETINCVDSKYEYEVYFTKRSIISKIFYNFSKSLINHVNKIKEALRRVNIEATTKCLLTERLEVCNCCFDYIGTWTSHGSRYTDSSINIILFYSNIPVKLKILRDKYKIIEIFQSIKFCLIQVCLQSLTIEEIDAFTLIEQRILRLFRSLAQINENCTTIVTNLQIIRKKYGKLQRDNQISKASNFIGKSFL
ncbi:uncharacterized protein VNE69_03099 [Vairimorpha necatrix]|uniref:Uncharacterized protein n=1 Tax=Vairimorpha necatrix TaxID=6039 RepID=A0AAX4JAJ5_9MICR